MKVGTVRASQMMRYDRMDPAFHLAVQAVEAKAEALAVSMSVVDVVAQLSQLATPDLGAPLEPLLTGAQTKHQRPALLAAVEKYPFIAYALVLAHKDQLLASANERLAAEQGYIQVLETFGKGVAT